MCVGGLRLATCDLRLAADWEELKEAMIVWRQSVAQTILLVLLGRCKETTS